jgi:putative oxidoreductase
MKKFFAPYNLPLGLDLALLLIRLVCGYAFILHGLGKIQHPMDWMGPQSTTPGFLQLLAAFSEFGGGIALILGLIVRLASLGILITMAVAVYTHAVAMGDPFMNPKGGSSFEPASVYFCVAVVLLAAGAGRFSLDKLIFGDRANLK